MTRDKSHGSSTGPVIIVRGLTSVKGLEGIELLDTLITYLWHIHGLDYYGLVETSDPKGLRHVRTDGKSSDGQSSGAEWENKVDSHWQERLKGQDPYVRKIRVEKYGWKYGCGAKGCTKLFHAAEFVHKHLKLKHPELVMQLTSKVREDLYFQNYMSPLGPFVPAPPEVAMLGSIPFEGGGRNGRSGPQLGGQAPIIALPQLGGQAPIIALPQAFRQDPRRLRSVVIKTLMHQRMKSL